MDAWYGRWDDRARAVHAAEAEQRNEAAAVHASDGAFDPDATRAAIGEFTGRAPVLAGEVDVAAPPRATAEYAGLFADVKSVVQDGAGHFPWLDDPATFVSAVEEFLRG